MTSNQFGCLGEYKFALECMSRGYDVSMPLRHSSPYDLIVDVDSQLYKIQVKSHSGSDEGNRSTVKFLLDVKSKNREYLESDVDYFALYSVHFDAFFIMHYSIVGGMSAVRVSPDNKYGIYINDYSFTQHTTL